MRKYVTVGSVQVHLGIIAMLCALLLLSSALALVYYTKTIIHQASIVSFGEIQTYMDESCTQPLNSHNWDNFNVSSGDATQSLDVYVKNKGNTKVNVTWVASGFTSYNGTTIQYEDISWILYLVDDSETRLRPENDTSPSKVQLLSGEVVHLKFYLTAKAGASPGSFTFQTTFKSRSD